jgi:ATP-dependent DNA ligase
LQCGRRCG